jgi:hypothetical protein
VAISGRRRGSDEQVPDRLASACPRPGCEAAVGRACQKRVGQQWLPMTDTHPERKELRRKSR